MYTQRLNGAIGATLAGIALLLAVPTIAAPFQEQKRFAPAKPTIQDPRQYIQRASSAKGEFVRTLMLFRDGRALLVSANVDRPPAIVQTGTWKRGSRPDRFSISLTRQNNNRLRETILMSGTPGSGGVLTAIGASASQYGAYGLTFVPRAATNLGFLLDPHLLNNGVNDGTLKIDAEGISSVTIPHVSNAQPTADGNDVLYWKTDDLGRGAVKGESLFYFSTLTGKSQQLATFPAKIQKVEEARSASGRPVAIVSYLANGKLSGVSVIDLLRYRTVKQWTAARVAGVRDNKVLVATYRAQDMVSDPQSAKAMGTQSVALDSVL